MVSIRTAKMNVHPSSYTNDKGVTSFSCEVFEPVRHRFAFSPDGMMPIEQMKSVLTKAQEEGNEVEIEFSQGQYGNFMIYNVKPLPKKV